MPSKRFFCGKRSPRPLVRAVWRMTHESKPLATVVDSAFVTFQTLRWITYMDILLVLHIHSSTNEVNILDVLAMSPENTKSHVKYILTYIVDRIIYFIWCSSVRIVLGCSLWRRRGLGFYCGKRFVSSTASTPATGPTGPTVLFASRRSGQHLKMTSPI